MWDVKGTVIGSWETVCDSRDQIVETFSAEPIIPTIVDAASVIVPAGIQTMDFLEAAYGDMWSIVQVPEFNVRDVRVGTIFDDEDLQGTSSIDLIHGGTGNDTLIGSGNDDILDGGKGYDTVDYSQLDREIVVRVDQLEAKADFIAYVLKGADWDGLYGIERIEGTPFQDTLIVAGPIPDDLDLTVDANGGQGPNPKDTIDATAAAKQLDIQVGSDGSGWIKALDGSGGTIKLEGFNTVIHGSAFGDRIEDLSGHATEVYGGGGDDVIHVAGAGSELYGGAGADRFQLSDDVLIGDASGEDGLSFLGLADLTGGVRQAESETPWAMGASGVRYAFNPAGEMVVSSGLLRGADGDPWMTYVAGVSPEDVGPDSVQGERPLGLYVIEKDIDFTRLLDPDLPKGWWSDFWRIQFGDTLKAMTGTSYFEGVDPLVLDLDGDGIELSGRSSVSPRFDMDGDGFAEPSGWVLGDDGLLALDADQNGSIDDVSELFGSPLASGFAELATHDANLDGVIDAQDAVFADLRVWQDADRDAVTDAGELKTLADLGIESISLTTQAPATGEIAGNVIDAEGTFTFTGGATGTVADVRFRIDNFDTVWLGDTTVSAQAAALPDVKGRGTLTDLHVAMTQDPGLLQTVETTLPTLTATDLDTLRAQATPILAAWAAPDTSARPSIPLLLTDDGQGGEEVSDFGVPLGGDVWALASGDPVLDANQQPIIDPSFADVEAYFQTLGTADTLSGTHLGFVERHLGEHIPFEDVTPGNTQAIAGLTGLLDMMLERLDVVTVRLAAQGPLGATYFQGIEYDVEADGFKPTTDRQLIPTFEAIFAAAPGDPGQAAGYLAGWSEVLDVIVGDYDRGDDHLLNSYSFLFSNIVAAYESTGLPIGIVQAADLLGVPSDIVVSGADTLDGTDENDIFYMDAGDETARGGEGHDAYVFGQGFGHDVIDDVEPPLGNRKDDLIRFADTASSEVTATRQGLDLTLAVDGTSDTVTVLRQFEGTLPGLFGGDFSDDTGIAEIAGLCARRGDIRRAQVFMQ
jgi:hypothetical protein